MDKIIDYKVISEYGKDKLVEQVKAAIINDWQPLGAYPVLVLS